MRFIISTLVATLIATSPFALADDCSSVACALGDFACNRICQLEGKPAGGKCVQRDGCPAGDEICVCNASKKRGITDGDSILERSLEGVSLDTFIEGVFEEPAAEKRGEDLDKRSICCSLPPVASGFCCEIHCEQIGHPEGGQCQNNVCTCG